MNELRMLILGIMLQFMTIIILIITSMFYILISYTFMSTIVRFNISWCIKRLHLLTYLFLGSYRLFVFRIFQYFLKLDYELKNVTAFYVLIGLNK